MEATGGGTNGEIYMYGAYCIVSCNTQLFVIKHSRFQYISSSILFSYRLKAKTIVGKAFAV